MAGKFSQLVADLQDELQAKQAELTALETKIRALRLTEAEITARVGDHKTWKLKNGSRKSRQQRASLPRISKHELA